MTNEESFKARVPKYTRCSDSLSEEGSYKLLRAKALNKRYIGLNTDAWKQAITCDVDRPNAEFDWEKAKLPQPNIIVINLKSGHCQYTWLLSSPVSNAPSSRRKPMEFFEAVRRGFTKRLNADRGYVNVLMRNPLHDEHKVIWCMNEGYELSELDDYLDQADKQFETNGEEPDAAGRNCEIFNIVRKQAYKMALYLQSIGEKKASEVIMEKCQSANMRYIVGLGLRELAHITKSIVRFILNKYQMGIAGAESVINSQRANLRWAKARANGFVSERESKPWLQLGISRSTYYARKAAGLIVGAAKSVIRIMRAAIPDVVVQAETEKETNNWPILASDSSKLQKTIKFYQLKPPLIVHE